MNNDQFRKLVLANSEKSSASKDGGLPAVSSPAGGNALGSRQRASIPMTPRALGNAQADLARQLAERNNATRPQKKFKSSAPKGVKLSSEYVDRAKERQENEEDDRAKRLEELEKALKNEEIDQETFDKMRFQIAGGDLSSTHLVKGLDFKLLEKIRRGEDIYGEKKAAAENEASPEPDIDEAFDELEEREVQAIAKDKTEKKKGQLSTVPLAPGRKRTRDQILAELKASRQAAKAQEESALGSRFKKVGEKQKPGTRIERDSKGREVLIIVDEDGHEKRKVRKVQPEAQKGGETARPGLLMPDKDAKPLGTEVPEQYRKKEEPEEDKDIDIFDDVGDDYDPLAGMEGSDSDSEDEGGKRDGLEGREEEEGEVADKSMPPPSRPQASSAPRNYFKDSKTGLVSQEEIRAPSMSDPAIMAAIKRAAALNPINKGEDDDDDDDDDGGEKKDKALEERRKKMLQMRDRDDEDIDMGFGTSRFEDEEDFDESKVKLSTWGDGDDGEDDSRGGKSKRKRGPKKRKGDVNSAADVLRVMEQRKKS